MRFKIISFDVEGTLISHRFSEIIWEEEIPKLYAKKVGFSLSKAKSFVKKEYNKITEDRVEWYDIQYWFNHFGLKNYQKLLNDHKRKIFYYPEVQSVLEDLSKKFKLIISSNSAREFLNLETERVRKYFHHIFSAPSDFRQIKKTTDVYLRICEFLEVTPSEVIHVGDNWSHDFITPRKIGLLSFYLDRKECKRGEFFVYNLKEFNIRLSKLEKVGSLK